LKDWFEKGPKSGELKNYPYTSMQQYEEMYCDDIAAGRYHWRGVFSDTHSRRRGWI